MKRLILLLVISCLAACASASRVSPGKRIQQNETLRAHPALLGQPVPAPASPATVSAEEAPAVVAQPLP